jgi:hypothetical protein
MLPVDSIVKSIHLHFLAGNFLVWQMSTSCQLLAGRHQAGQRAEVGPAGLLGALVAAIQCTSASDIDAKPIQRSQISTSHKGFTPLHSVLLSPVRLQAFRRALA